MKKRKIKLFASVASLAMVAAVMGVGVWAASTQAVAVSTHVNFTSTAIAADIDLAITGFEWDKTADEGAGALSSTTMILGTSTIGGATSMTKDDLAVFGLEDKATTSPTPTDIVINLTDTDQNGVINAGSQIKYVFTINADADSKPIFFKAVSDYEGTDFKVKMAIGEAAATEVKEVLDNETGIAANGDETITIIYEAVDTITVLNNVDLGDVTITLNSDKAAITPTV